MKGSDFPVPQQLLCSFMLVFSHRVLSHLQSDGSIPQGPNVSLGEHTTVSRCTLPHCGTYILLKLSVCVDDAGNISEMMAKLQQRAQLQSSALLCKLQKAELGRSTQSGSVRQLLGNFWSKTRCLKGINAHKITFCGCWS